MNSQYWSSPRAWRASSGSWSRYGRQPSSTQGLLRPPAAKPSWETRPMDVTVAVLAGGKGSRMGGDKALVELAGRPLISYALQAAHDAGLPTVIVAKRTTRLPPVTTRLLFVSD